MLFGMVVITNAQFQRILRLEPADIAPTVLMKERMHISWSERDRRRLYTATSTLLKCRQRKSQKVLRNIRRVYSGNGENARGLHFLPIVATCQLAETIVEGSRRGGEWMVGCETEYGCTTSHASVR